MGIRVACLCLVLAYFAYSVASLEWELHSLSSLSIPVFIWSDKQIFSSNNVQVTDTITTKDMEFVLASLMHTTKSQSSKLSTSFNDVSGSEVVVLFIEPELRTDQVPSVASAYSSSSSGSFSHLKDALNSAASSMVIPYTSVEEVSLFDETLMDTFESIKEGSIFITRTFGSELFPLLGRLNGIKTVEVDALLAELKSTNAFANGVTDLVVVCFDKATSNEKSSLANHDEIIGSISNSIRSATKGNYVAMYAANMPASARFVWTFNEPVELLDFQFMLADAANNTTNPNSTSSSKVNYFPGALIEVYLIVGILITMLFTGGCAIFSLQTPDRWEAPKINKRADL